MSVRSADLVFRAGGKVFDELGVARARRSPSEEVVETFTRASKALYWDRNGVIRQAGNNVLRAGWEDRDGDGVYETATIPLDAAMTQLVEFAIPGGTEASFDTIPLGVLKAAFSTAAFSEYAVNIETGDRLEYVVSNMNPDSFSGSVIVVPQFASDDGLDHIVFEFRRDASNKITVQKLADNTIRARVTKGGVNTDSSITPSAAWTAGTVVYFAFRSTGNFDWYFATTGATSLQSASSAYGAGLGAGTWTLGLGGAVGGGTQALGAYSTIIGDNGDPTPYSVDRFAAGVFQNFSTWLDTWRNRFALYVGGDASVPRAIDRSGLATDLLGGNAEGAYSFLKTGAGATVIESTATFAALDGATKATFMAKFNAANITQANQAHIAGVWGGAGAGNSDVLSLGFTDSSGLPIVRVAADNAGSVANCYFNNADMRGQEVEVFVVYDGTGVGNAGRLYGWYRIYTGSTPSAWTAITFNYQNAAVPAALNTPSNATHPKLTFGRFDTAFNGSNRFEGTLDDFRLIVGTAHTTTIRDLQYINEARFKDFTYWLSFDASATDLISALAFTVTNGTQVTDGRHAIGLMERFTLAGQYVSKGTVTDKIDHGTYAALNGASKFANEFVVTCSELPSAGTSIWEIGRLTVDGMIGCYMGGANGSLQIWVHIDATTATLAFSPAGLFVLDVPTKIRVEFDGTQTGNANRMKAYSSTQDVTTGVWSAEVAISLSFSGASIPAALTTPGSGSNNNHLYVGADHQPAPTPFRGTIDRFALHAASLPASKTIYQSGAAIYDIWCDYNGNANNAGLTGSANNGTATGFKQWYDGRQPVGFTLGGADIFECDRATAAAYKTEGTFGLRLKHMRGGTERGISILTPITSGRLLWLGATLREDAGRIYATFEDFPFDADTSGASMARVTRAGWATSSPGSGVLTVEEDGSGAGYVDKFEGMQFVAQAASVATKGTAMPALNGAGGAYGVAVATIVTPDGTLVPNVFDAGLSSQGQKIIKLDTGVSGTHARGYRIGAVGGLNGLSVNTYGSMVVGLLIKSTSAINVANVKIRCIDSAGNTVSATLTATKGIWQWLSVQRLIDPAATFAYFEIQCEDGTNFATANDALYIAMPTVVALRCRPYPIANDAEGTVTQATEPLSFAFTAPPQLHTGYIKFMERGTVFRAGSGLVVIGDGSSPAGTETEFLIVNASNYRLSRYQNSAASQANSDMTGAGIVIGDVVELSWSVSLTGVVTLSRSVNGGAVTTYAASSALAFASIYNVLLLYLGCRDNADSERGFASIDDFKLALGSYSLAEMRDAA